MHHLASTVTIWLVIFILTGTYSGSISNNVDKFNFLSEFSTYNPNSKSSSTMSYTLVYVYDNLYKERLASRIEIAFDTYRRELTKYMAQVDEVVTAMTRLDELSFNHGSTAQPSPLKKVHDQFRTDIKRVPELWEHNEQILRSLLQPRNVRLTTAILNTTSKYFSCIYMHICHLSVRSLNIEYHCCII